jgi:hypothetical protein
MECVVDGLGLFPVEIIGIEALPFLLRRSTLPLGHRPPSHELQQAETVIVGEPLIDDHAPACMRSWFSVATGNLHAITQRGDKGSIRTHPGSVDLNIT